MLARHIPLLLPFRVKRCYYRDDTRHRAFTASMAHCRRNQHLRAISRFLHAPTWAHILHSRHFTAAAADTALHSPMPARNMPYAARVACAGADSQYARRSQGAILRQRRRIYCRDGVISMSFGLISMGAFSDNTTAGRLLIDFDQDADDLASWRRSGLPPFRHVSALLYNKTPKITWLVSPMRADAAPRHP